MAALFWLFNFSFFTAIHALQTHRIPNRSDNSPSSSCHPNLCSGPPDRYSVSNMYFYAEFNVPPLPKQFSGAQTYYIYYNIFFGDPYGKFNQFVPQLMLGSALSGSDANYNPIFTNMKRWHFGSQYFFALYNDSDPDGWTPYAATGDLIDTYEGDILYTSFSRSSNGKRWRLEMGIKGNESAVSVVETDAPYMGLLNSVTSYWNEDVYNKTTIGCCWELYNIQKKDNYPPFMNYTIVTTDHDENATFFQPWQMDEIPDCTYSPKYSLNTNVTAQTRQTAYFDIFYET